MGTAVTMKLYQTALGTLLTLGVVAAPALAESSVPRFSAQALIGLNLFLPYFGGEVSYRLPVLSDRIDVYADYALNVTLCGCGGNQSYLVGARYYFKPSGWWQPYATVRAGWMELGGTVPDAEVGIGADLMAFGHVGMDAAVFAGLPAVVRPQLGLKIAL